MSSELNQILTYLVLGGLGLAILALIVVAILTRLKGKLRITTDQDFYQLGDSLSGRVSVQTRGLIKGRKIELHLVCDRHIEGTRHQKSSRNRIYHEN